MTQLRSLTVHFNFTFMQLTNARLHRDVLSCLLSSTLRFNEYLGDFVDRIDAPLLELVDLRFSNGLAFEIPHLSHFIRCTSQLVPMSYYTTPGALFHFPSLIDQ
jgi:hypothetical protein